MKKVCFGAIFTTVLLIGCQVPSGSQGTGSLALSWQAELQARYLAPDLSIEAVEFVITGDGPAGQTLSASSSSWLASFSNLAAGLWIVNVQALNEDGTILGENEAGVEIVAGQIASLALEILPLTGLGQVSVDLTWDPEYTFNPSLSIAFAPIGVIPKLNPVDLSEEGLFSVAESLPAGYYALHVALFDQVELSSPQVKVAGGVEFVRVVAGETTSGTVNIQTLNALTGNLVSFWSWNPMDPITFVATDMIGPHYLGSTLSYGVQPESGFPELTFQWFLNGEYLPEATASSVDVFGDALGHKRLDVFVQDPISGRVGSTSIFINIVEYPSVVPAP